MKLIVNARFLTQQITGVQRFAIELSKRLKKQTDIDVQFVSPKGVIHTDLANELNAKVIGHFGGHLWEQFELPRYLKRNNYPMLLSLCSTAPGFYINQIVTHHDITYIRCPESFSKKFIGFYKFIVPLMLKNSKKIITVSNFSKDEVSNYFKIPKDKFVVIYNGVDAKQFNTLKAKDPSAPKYILAVSSRNFHKNFQGLIKAFKDIKDELKDVNLYIVGSSEIKSFNNIALDIEDLKQEKRIQFLGRVDDQELIETYQKASLFVFPSFYEGFGIPPLEAQACGCPVIASDKASMPEVLADSVLYFDPTSTAELSEQIKFFYNNPEQKDRLVEQGFQNIKRFDWDNSFRKLMEAIKK
ncbi:glycosyltransferase family 4 protein [Epilithonimonas tenax]|uniref:glycosyltransferase family 4 protein n=1 Tax=Epilithonimonas tenax TaxID=191577 RepID=UPI00041B8B12|nr:glycosyltransferase family 1 protein [Epilithonimonas tenax]